MSSNSANAKIDRAISQLERAEILLRQLPRKLYKDKRDVIDEATRDIERIQKNIKRNLANKP